MALKPNKWNRVSDNMNPADDASLGLTADVFLSQGRWLMGPEYLWKPEHMWPMQTEEINDVLDGDPEVKMDVKVCMSSLDKQSCPLLKYFQKCSSWIRLKKDVAWLLRYRERLPNASKNKELNRDVPKYITLEEIEKAEREILRHSRRVVACTNLIQSSLTGFCTLVAGCAKHHYPWNQSTR